jgi:hypothetical protein
MRSSKERIDKLLVDRTRAKPGKRESTYYRRQSFVDGHKTGKGTLVDLNAHVVLKKIFLVSRGGKAEYALDSFQLDVKTGLPGCRGFHGQFYPLSFCGSTKVYADVGYGQLMDLGRYRWF